jgi:hypothetical protein
MISLNGFERMSSWTCRSSVPVFASRGENLIIVNTGEGLFSICQLYRQQTESRLARYTPKIVGLVWFWSKSIQCLNLKEITRRIFGLIYCGPNQFLDLCNTCRSWDCTDQVRSILNVRKGKEQIINILEYLNFKVKHEWKITTKAFW